jgi:hypothetical protein
MPTFNFAGLSEQQIREMILHEGGHVVVGRALGFPPGGIILKNDMAGADSDHLLSFPDKSDGIAYIEKRIQTLFAGAIAQSLNTSNKCQPAKCRQFLETSAMNDMAKIRELCRVMVGYSHPGLDLKGFGDKLAEEDARLSDAAVKTVEANAILIREIVEAFVLGLKENVKGAATISKVRLTSYTFPSSKIDGLIHKTPIVAP